MSALHLIEAELRQGAGTGPSREVRRQGRVPGILYGQNQDAVLLSVDPRIIHKEMRYKGFFSKLFEIQIGSKKERAIVKDVQLHPVTDQPLHIDFMRISKDRKVHVSVPVSMINEEKCPGLKKGGVLNVTTHNLELMCDPEHLPNHIDIDLSTLEVGHSIHLSQIQLPPKATPYFTNHDVTIVAIVAPAAEEANTEAAVTPTADTSKTDKK